MAVKTDALQDAVDFFWTNAADATGVHAGAAARQLHDLRIEVERLGAAYEIACERWDEFIAEVERLRAENERLRKRVSHVDS